MSRSDKWALGLLLGALILGMLGLLPRNTEELMRIFKR